MRSCYTLQRLLTRELHRGGEVAFGLSSGPAPARLLSLAIHCARRREPPILQTGWPPGGMTVQMKKYGVKT